MRVNKLIPIKAVTIMLEPLSYFYSYKVPNVFIHVYYVHNENLVLKVRH